MSKPQAPAVIFVNKKSRHGGGGHHGGAWKVAYADFVTAMMAFFLVMWLVSQSSETKAAVAGYFRNPGAFKEVASTGILPGGGALGDTPGGTPKVTMTAAPGDGGAAAAREKTKLLQTADHIKQDLLKLPEFGALIDQIEIRVTSEGLRIELVEREGSSFFASGSAVLRGESVGILAVVAAELKKLTNEVVIEGHTDSQPYSLGGYGNWELSADRANAARRVVEQNGVAGSQLRGIRGYADRQLHFPKAPLDPRNRRVSVVVRSEAVGAIEAAMFREGKPQVVTPRDAHEKDGGR